MFEKIKAYMIEEMQVSSDKITPDAELMNDLGFNSLELAEMVLYFEENYNIEVDEEEAKNFVTVGDVAKYLDTLIK